MNIKITNWIRNTILFECESESLKEAVEKAVEEKAYLQGAYLQEADLKGAYLQGAYLQGADLDSKYCFLSISPIGSESGCLWVMKNDDGILMYHRGCFIGTKEEFLEAVKKKHAGTDFEKKYLAAVKFIEVMHEQNP